MSRLRAGANPNARSEHGLTPLALAATNGTLAVVQPLLDAHADVNTVAS